MPTDWSDQEEADLRAYVDRDGIETAMWGTWAKDLGTDRPAPEVEAHWTELAARDQLLAMSGAGSVKKKKKGRGAGAAGNAGGRRADERAAAVKAPKRVGLGGKKKGLGATAKSRRAK
jgi:hypothetical protein